MDYMTLKEAAEKWGVTPRRVNYYCAAGRIPGAVKMAGVWLIPKNAEKPIDGRTIQVYHQSQLYIIGIIVQFFRHNKVIPSHKPERYNIAAVNLFAIIPKSVLSKRHSIV